MFKTISMAPAAAAILATVVFSGNAYAAAKNNCGHASWYALTSRTASGERMDASKLTAAHRSLKFGTRVQVTNARTGKTVTVRINDRGPFIRGRVIDVSKAAARHLGMVGSGVAKVCYKIVS